MKLLFSALGFVAGALFVSAGRRTPSSKSTPVATPAPVNKVMPGTSGPTITFTIQPRYDSTAPIPDDVLLETDKFLRGKTTPETGLLYAGTVPDDYQTQMEKKIDEAIIREIIQERKRDRDRAA